MAAKRRSYSTRKHTDDTPEGRWILNQGTHFIWWQLLARGVRIIGSVKVLGLSIRFDVGSVLVIVRGLDLERVENVVIFGSGQSLYRAFVNATHAMQKAEWKPDKYHLMTP